MQACKVCQGSVTVWNYTDFNKTCNDHSYFEWLDIPISYYKCGCCGLLATDYFDDWNYAMFSEEIYNEDYHLVDPDYSFIRPEGNAKFLSTMIETDKTILDYGGGNGKTAQLMRDKGYHATFWDVMSGLDKPEGLFDVVVAIEVFEHTTDPIKTFEEALSFMKQDGKLIFTTLTNNSLKHREMSWYMAPRNGHILMHSRESIQELGAKCGVIITHMNDSLHVAEY